MLVNGIPAEQISALDRGLQYGDGLFETIAVFNGRPCLWGLHCRRLALGCERLGIPAPDLELLAAEARQLIAAAVPGESRAVLKILLTRGVGGRGYRPAAAAQPTRILSLSPWPDYPPDAASEGVCVRVCDLRLASQPRLAGIKHLNRLEQVMARMEWDDPAIFEGLLLDRQGHLIEGTLSNLFLWRDGRLVTPALEECGVAGVAREAVLVKARQLGVTTEVRPTPLQEALDADLPLLSNALIGLWPVRQLGKTRYNPASIPRELLDALREPIHRPEP